jgi:hypothetical protein
MPRARRSPFGTFLAVVAGLAVALGVVGWWAGRTLGDADAFASLASGLLRQETVVARLATAVVDPVLRTAPEEVQRQRPVIVTTTRSVLADDRFVPVFESVLRRAHRSLLEGTGDVHLQLSPALDAVVVEVRRVAPAIADQLEGVTPPRPVILSAAQASRVRSVVGFERAATFALLAGGAILLAIAAIGGGPRALLPFGMTLALGCILALVLLLGVGALVGVEVSGASRDAASSAFGVVVGGLRTSLLLGAAAGVAAAIVGAVAGRRRPA